MSFAICFAILMLIWLVFGFWTREAYKPVPHMVIIFLLLLLLGWKVFGALLHP